MGEGMRQKLIQVRVSEEVHRALKSRAALAGKALGAWVVEQALGAELLEIANTAKAERLGREANEGDGAAGDSGE